MSFFLSEFKPLLCIGDLLDAGVNRSPSSYLNNPAAERSKYKYNVDKEMTLVKFVDSQLGPIGSFNWFATHGTSMSRTNSLISGDNKGAAARFMEDWFEVNGQKKNSDSSSKIPRRVSTIVSDLSRNRESNPFLELPNVGVFMTSDLQTDQDETYGFVFCFQTADFWILQLLISHLEDGLRLSPLMLKSE